MPIVRESNVINDRVERFRTLKIDESRSKAAYERKYAENVANVAIGYSEIRIGSKFPWVGAPLVIDGVIRVTLNSAEILTRYLGADIEITDYQDDVLRTIFGTDNFEEFIDQSKERIEKMGRDLRNSMDTDRNIENRSREEIEQESQKKSNGINDKGDHDIKDRGVYRDHTRLDPKHIERSRPIMDREPETQIA